MQRFRRLVHHSYNTKSLEIISTRTNNQAGRTYVALSCGIRGLEGNATGVSISIDMVKTRLLVLLTYCNRGGGGVSVCGLSYISRFAASELSGDDWSAPDLPWVRRPAATIGEPP